ncbi:MAG: DUF4235 domain-containing protein [Actinomycetota bacterium]
MGKLVWKVMGSGATEFADVAARKLVTTVWRVAVGKRPPGHISDPRVSWPAAIGWAAGSGAVVGVARLLATRKAAAYYTKSAGHPPEALQEGQLAVGSL